MRRLSFVAYIVLFALVMPVFAQKNPVAARKPLRFWVERLSHKDPKIRERAADFLIRDAELNGLWEVYVPDSQEREKLEAFRKEAKPLIPELLKVLKSTDVTLVNADAEENVLMAAAGVLMVLGPEARSVTPELERIVLDKKTDCITRAYGFQSLLFATPEDEPVGPVLLKLLNSLPKETLLIKLFCEDQNTIKLIGEDLDSTNDDNGKLSGDALIETSLAISAHVYTILLASSGHTKSEIPSLVKIASGDYPQSMRAIAIGILGLLTYDAKSSVPVLRKLLKDEDRLIRRWAASSLIQIESDPKLGPMIVEALKLDGKEREEY